MVGGSAARSPRWQATLLTGDMRTITRTSMPRKPVARSLFWQHVNVPAIIFRHGCPFVRALTMKMNKVDFMHFVCVHSLCSRVRQAFHNHRTSKLFLCRRRGAPLLPVLAPLACVTACFSA